MELLDNMKKSISNRFDSFKSMASNEAMKRGIMVMNSSYAKDQIETYARPFVQEQIKTVVLRCDADPNMDLKIQIGGLHTMGVGQMIGRDFRSHNHAIEGKVYAKLGFANVKLEMIEGFDRKLPTIGATVARTAEATTRTVARTDPTWNYDMKKFKGEVEFEVMSASMQLNIPYIKKLEIPYKPIVKLGYEHGNDMKDWTFCGGIKGGKLVVITADLSLADFRLENPPKLGCTLKFDFGRFTTSINVGRQSMLFGGDCLGWLSFDMQHSDEEKDTVTNFASKMLEGNTGGEFFLGNKFKFGDLVKVQGGGVYLNKTKSGGIKWSVGNY